MIAPMEIKDLLDWGVKTTESSKESETLHTWLASALILAHTQLEAVRIGSPSSNTLPILLQRRPCGLVLRCRHRIVGHL